jgi:glyoxylase-like metal-dependent hydrolase (beta-lactamase superfamily II)
MLDTAGLSLREIAKGVYAWIGANGDSNAGAVVTGEGVVAIDAQQTLTQARQFRAAIGASTGLPVLSLVNTHFHLDHTAGNEAFADAPILAHERTRTMMEHYLGPADEGRWVVSATEPKLRLFFGSNIRDLVPPGSAAEPWFIRRMSGADYNHIVLRAPTWTFADSFSFHGSGDRLRLDYWGPAHSDGDLVVRLEQAKIAFLGDLMFHGRFPWLGDCDLDGWIEQLARILCLDLDIIVPGHGPVVTLAEVAKFRDLLLAIRGTAADAISIGASEEAAVQDARLAQFEHMPRYVEWMPFNIRAVYRYLKSR